MRHSSLIIMLIAGFYLRGFCQEKPELFKKLPLDSIGVKSYQLLCTKGGALQIITSAGICKVKGRQLDMPAVALNGFIYAKSTGGLQGFIKNFRSPNAEDSIRAMAEGIDSIFMYVTRDNKIYYSPNSEMIGTGWPPYYFPSKGKNVANVQSLLIDDQGNLLIGCESGEMYLIEGGASFKKFLTTENKIIDSAIAVVKGEIPVISISTNTKATIQCFWQDRIDKSIIWTGTSQGLFTYNRVSRKLEPVLPSIRENENYFTVSHIEADQNNNLWFSTLEKGMGYYDRNRHAIQFFPYPKKSTGNNIKYPINTFCQKSPGYYFVAVMDSFPAIFSAKNGQYNFIADSSLNRSAMNTTDIKVDQVGNIFLIKGGATYFCKSAESKLLATAIKPDSNLLAPFIRSVSLAYGKELASINYNPEILSNLSLPHDQNSLVVYFDVNDLGDEHKIKFAWKMDGYTDDWVILPTIDFDSANSAYLSDLKPGNYQLELKVKVGDEDWRPKHAKISIVINPAFWQTVWFWLFAIVGFSVLIYSVFKWRLNAVRKTERLKSKYEIEILELEAKSLRAQMNPHFIFNCLNSIKSLIQQEKNDKAITYLTTFSKLIRTIFQNADKKEITLFDEIETCRLYLQLEAMRFDAKFTYSIEIDKDLDMKSLTIPALTIQPFIENAIWHGIVPGVSGGHIQLAIGPKQDTVEIIIDDNGIGREASILNKSNGNLVHQSKGVNIAVSRLDLDSKLKHRKTDLQIVDKKKPDGSAAGTTVIITLKGQLS